MISSTMMYVLVVFYLIISFVSATESNWPRALYWIGASLITYAVLWGMKV